MKSTQIGKVESGLPHSSAEVLCLPASAGQRAPSFSTLRIGESRRLGNGLKGKCAHNDDFRYPTICQLAGVSGKDDPPVPPEPVDPANPTKNIYGSDSYPPVDGVNIWPMLTNPAYSPTNYTAAHAQLWISEEVLIMGQYKIVVAQQEPQKTNNPPVYG